MVNLKNLENAEYLAKYKESLQNRSGSDINLKNLEILIQVAAERKQIVLKSETTKAEQNKLSQEIGKFKKEGKDISSLMTQVEVLKEAMKTLSIEVTKVEDHLNFLSLILPNKPHDSVPVGTDEKTNQVEKTWGQVRSFSFKPKEHFELGEKLNIIDFERAAKTTGTRFAFLKGDAAKMERALIQLMMDVHSNQHGYTEMIPPFMVNAASMQGTGQFPKFKEDVFAIKDSDHYLIPTAEVPVTNYYRGEILKEQDLPQMFCAYSPCFRSEAGAAGRDTKGLIRQHQFDKVELMVFCLPEKSYEVHEQLTNHAEKILQILNLPYRKTLLCTGDMGFGSAKTYDLEVWLPGQNAYREISSCSNFEDFQARRANIRYKPQDGGKPQFVHTLNGSGLAVGRTLVAILENYQREDGTIEIPLALQKYMNKTEIK